MQAGPFIFDRVDAVDEEHVQVEFEVQRRAEAFDEGDGSGAGDPPIARDRTSRRSSG